MKLDFNRPRWRQALVRGVGAFMCAGAVTFVGCGLLGGWRVSESEAPSNGLHLLGSGELSGIEEAYIGVARDASAWEAMWRRHEARGEVPPIDFAVDMGVLVVRPHNTGGFSLRIKGLEQRTDHLLLTLVEEQPHEDELVIQVLTQPWVALRTPQYAGPVRLAVIEEPHP
jgi:hypothetical protein